MASATEIATRSLRRIGVIDALESPSAADVSSAKEALNAMIAAWEADGLSGDTLPLDGRFEQAVVAMLAVRMAEEYGKAPGPVLIRDAERGERQITAHFFAVPASTFDAPLLRMANDGGNETSTNVEQSWQAATEYALRQTVINGSNRYEVVTAGTSGSTGPTGTAAEITDGTAVWCWRGVVG